jgi:hypothetical protein
MSGLVPGIHVFDHLYMQDADGTTSHKSGKPDLW